MEANVDNPSEWPRRITKAFHRKTRNDCQTCRQRRVKVSPEVTSSISVSLIPTCDERRPVCLNCESRGVVCAFSDTTNEPSLNVPIPTWRKDSRPDAVNRPATDPVKGPSRANSAASLARYNNIDTVLDLPESRSRRLLELRLTVHWADHMAKPFPEYVDAHLTTAWGEQIPRMALKHDKVQYMRVRHRIYFVASRKIPTCLLREKCMWAWDFVSSLGPWRS